MEPILSQTAIRKIASRFSTGSHVQSAEPFGNGNINTTYKIITSGGSYILQKINGQVFPEPKKIMENLSALNQFFKIREVQRLLKGELYSMPEIMLSGEGLPYVIERGDIWRMISFIPDTYSVESVSSLHQASEVGKVLGLFHRWTSGMEMKALSDTLPGFHITSKYLNQYDKVISCLEKLPDDPITESVKDFITTFRYRGDRLENALSSRKLLLRVIHGDPKVSNILFEIKTNKGIAIIDLDTVKPGLVHYDIGDCLRSCCNQLGEETLQFEDVKFDLEICRVILKSYFCSAGNLLTEYDIQYLYDAVFIMIFELVVRFFTDYLQGNRYFKVYQPLQNLNRAYVQMKLAQNLELQKDHFRDMVTKMETF